MLAPQDTSRQAVFQMDAAAGRVWEEMSFVKSDSEEVLTPWINESQKSEREVRRVMENSSSLSFEFSTASSFQ